MPAPTYRPAAAAALTVALAEVVGGAGLEESAVFLGL